MLKTLPRLPRFHSISKLSNAARTMSDLPRTMKIQNGEKVRVYILSVGTTEYFHKIHNNGNSD